MVYLYAVPGEREPGRPPAGFARFGGQESWNWPSNSTITVRCCTTCPEVVLFLNDRPLGTNHLSEAVQGVLSWRVPFEPGVLRAVGRGNGPRECEFTLRSAGPAQRIELLPDTNELRANGRDVCHVEFRIVDAQGVRVPDAADEVRFTVEGPARVIGVENGDLNSPMTGKGGIRNAYHGRGLAILQFTRQAGNVRVTARAKDLDSAAVDIRTRP